MKKLVLSLCSVLALVMVVVSCGPTTDPLVAEAKKNLSQKNYQLALEAADQAITANPANGVAHYYRGVALIEIAAAKPDPESRKMEYMDMRESFDTAEAIFDTSASKPSEAGDIEKAVLSAWALEHNKGIEYVSVDSIGASVEDPEKVAISHLENATIINPDSTLSFEILAQVYYMDQNLEAAATTLDKALGMKEQPEAADYSRLAAYNMQLEKYDEAIEVLLAGLEQFPDSVDLVQKIADSYMQVGEVEKAMDTVRELIEKEPENVQYHLVLGTQVYQSAVSMTDEVSENYDKLFQLRQDVRSQSGDQKAATEQEIADLEEKNNATQAEIDRLTGIAIDELTIVINKRPDDAVTYNTLGIIYQNNAAALFEKRNATTDNDEAAKLDGEAKAELRKAMTNYEKAAELDPENTDYWSTLFRVYTTLGENEKAQAAMEKAGM
ncbi:MAG: tetratricopeptide repeat protein [Bacteroidota bacterium]